MLCNSILRNAGVLGAGKTVKYEPETSVLKLRIGDEIALDEAQFQLLSDAFFAEIHGVSGYQRRRDQLLAMTQLTPFRGRLADKLSGGMKQKLALACTLVHEPELILLDMMMPAMDGPSTLMALKNHPSTAEIPVIFLTAKAMPAEIERLKLMGALGVLTKPFDPVTLPVQIRTLLGK